MPSYIISQSIMVSFGLFSFVDIWVLLNNVDLETWLTPAYIKLDKIPHLVRYSICSSLPLQLLFNEQKAGKPLS